MHGREFKLLPSQQFFVLFTVVMTGSFGIVCFLPIHVFIKLCSLVGLGIYGVKIYQEWVSLQDPHAIISFQRDLSKENSWLIKTGHGVYPARLLGESTVTHIVSILCFACQTGEHQACVVFQDSLPADDYPLVVKAVC